MKEVLMTIGIAAVVTVGMVAAVKGIITAAVCYYEWKHPECGEWGE